MKRIALVLVAAMLLALCACGKMDTTVHLTIVEQGWSGWSEGQPEPKILKDKVPVRKGDVFAGEDWGGSWEIKVIGFMEEGAEVRLNTDCSKEFPPGVISGGPIRERIEMIPYGETFMIVTPTMDAGTNWGFTFSNL